MLRSGCFLSHLQDALHRSSHRSMLLNPITSSMYLLSLEVWTRWIALSNFTSSTKQARNLVDFELDIASRNSRIATRLSSVFHSHSLQYIARDSICPSITSFTTQHPSIMMKERTLQTPASSRSIIRNHSPYCEPTGPLVQEGFVTARIQALQGFSTREQIATRSHAP